MTNLFANIEPRTVAFYGAISVLCLFLLWYSIRGKGPLPLRHAAELLLLSFVLAVIMLRELLPMMLKGLPTYILSTFGNNIAIVVLFPLALSRLPISRALFMLGTAALVAFPVVLTQAGNSLHGLRSGLFNPEIIVNISAAAVFAFASFTTAFLFAAICVRHRFTYVRYLVGAVAGQAVATVLGNALRYNYSMASLFPLFGPAIFIFLVILLPLQREALERLTGIGLSPRSAVVPRRPAGFGTRLLALLGVAGLAMAFSYSSLFNYSLGRLRWLLNYSSVPRYRTHTQTNAYDTMRPLFRRPGSRPSPLEGATLTTPVLDLIHERTTVSELTSTLAMADAIEISDLFSSMSEHMGVLTPASQADYIRPRMKERIAFAQFRDTLKVMSLRAAIRAHEGETTAALQDIRTLYGLAALVRESPVLVEQMIGVSVQNTATTAASRACAIWNGKEEELRMLAELLDDVTKAARRPLDLDRLRRGEAWAQPFVIGFEAWMPDIKKADENTIIAAAQFDLMRIVVALERFAAAAGHYPASLDELVPQFLDRVPVEPFHGQNYEYSSDGTEFSLQPRMPHDHRRRLRVTSLNNDNGVRNQPQVNQ